MDNYSYLSNADVSALDELYQQYQQNPTLIDPSWARFFQGFDLGYHKAGSNGASSPADATSLSKEISVAQLITAYRTRAHLLSKTNPIRPRKERNPGVDLQYFNLSDADLNTKFNAGAIIGLPQATLNQIIERLQNLYCRSIGVEYMHIRDHAMRTWFMEKYEQSAHAYQFSIDKKKRILTKLNEAVAFENFLHKKYVGQKRFSLEGGENTIPALDAIINHIAELGAERVAIGMAHRGRLNVLANILGKTYEYIFNEFEGNAQPDVSFGDGDVKYHLGFSSQVQTLNNKNVHLDLVPNPSHLEAVNPVIEGFVRAKGELIYNGDFKKILPILIHGDAALAGQGIVYEVAQMSKLKGYTTGGTLHFVINNQIGFTTDFDDARSSDYSTAVGNAIDAPIIHVNGDDAEAIVYAVELAADFRQTFGTDVFVDMLCYRKHGHNESDEPKFTQPKLYNLIDKHPNPREVYSKTLIDRGDIDAQLALQLEKDFQAHLQDRLNMVKQKPLPYKTPPLDKQWENLGKAQANDFEQSPKTGVKATTVKQVFDKLVYVPKDITPLKKVQRLIDDRKSKFNEGKLDWAMAELLAYGTILNDGKTVRISGQDVKRGTFSHRHAVVFDENTNQPYIALNNISEKQGRFSIYNSLLSEYAVLGFEYGYSLASPEMLTVWEAQFGDFANGAQTVIDQFITSGESKWQRMSGLVMLLPHGYEGQGPEHSNARPERFLQLAAEYNIIVANVTTPANFFHLLRRQLAWNFRKPLIVMSPKQLLRHPLCISNVAELSNAVFQELIVEAPADSKSVKRVVLCSGKIYYDLLQYKLTNQRADVVLARVEQLYPMPESGLNALYEAYPKASFIWAQEEPKNMGYWTYMLRYQPNTEKLRLVARKSSASPATGFAKIHEQEQQRIINDAFNS